MNLNLVLVVLVAFLGGILASLLGWADSGGPFIFRKFFASLVRALFAAVVYGVGYTFRDGLTGWDLGFAFLGGAGVDVIGNRAAGVVSSLTTPKPSTPPTPP